jgi:UDP-glucose 6-dehydrogenase
VKHVEKMVGGSLKGKTIGLLGLAFKPNTDDMRDAPSIDISRNLIEAGAKVRAMTLWQWKWHVPSSRRWKCSMNRTKWRRTVMR